ncbi:YveK family protein [Paenibacillus sp. y28]|uniref:YveK family protein n=1 Tax=Paenibacillus sp. y28 TaxID=3129110 RepID=UPI00301763C5
MELNELFQIVKKRLWLIVCCVLVAVVTTAVYSYYYIQPVYFASTKLIVNKTIEIDQIGREQMDFGAMGINFSLINTYKEIIKNPAITEKVVQRHPELGLTAERLSQVIDVQSVNNTQVMTITARDSSYPKAMQIANAVSEVFQTEIPKIMKVDNVTILNAAQMQENPVPMNASLKNQYMLIGVALALLFGIAISFLIEYLDDTLKTEEDVMQLLGTPVLAAVGRLPGNQMLPMKKKPIRKRAGEASNAKLEH